MASTPKSPDCSSPNKPDRIGCYGGGRLLSGNPKSARKKRKGIGRSQTDEECTVDCANFAVLESDSNEYNARAKIREYLRMWAIRHTTDTAQRKVLKNLVNAVGHNPTKDRWLQCWPKQQTISDAEGIPIRTVEYAISRLRDLGLIGIKYKYGKAGTPLAGKRVGATYTLYCGLITGRLAGSKSRRLAGSNSDKSEQLAGQNLLELKEERIYIDSDENEKRTPNTVDWNQYESIPTHVGARQEKRALEALNGRQLTYQEQRDRGDLLAMLDLHKCFHGETLYKVLTNPSPIFDYISALKGSWKAGKGIHGKKLSNRIMNYENTNGQPQFFDGPNPARPPRPQPIKEPVSTGPRYSEEYLTTLAKRICSGEVNPNSLKDNLRNAVNPYVLKLQGPPPKQSRWDRLRKAS